MTASEIVPSLMEVKSDLHDSPLPQSARRRRISLPLIEKSLELVKVRSRKRRQSDGISPSSR